MRNPRINYVVVGSFVLVVLAGFVLTIARLSGRGGAAETYYTSFSSVAGIVRGTKVLYQGYGVGQVEDVEPVRRDERQVFRVAMSIRSGWPVASDAVAHISTGFLSAVTIDIHSDGAGETLPPESEIPGRDPTQVFQIVSEVAGEVNAIMRDTVRPLVEQVAERVPEMVDDLDAFSTSLRRTGEQMEAVFTEENRDNINNILSNLDTTSDAVATLSQNLGTTRQQLADILVKIDALVGRNEANVDQALHDLRYSLESVARHIDTINYNLEGTSRNMNEFSREIRENPGVLLGGKAAGEDAEVK
jgi:phospholipid/cholesterol/gamma-HCH transport system substrate-binding protein